MYSCFKTVLSGLLYVFAGCGILIIPSLSDTARGQTCVVEWCKVAEPGGDGITFLFTVVTESGGGGDIPLIANGDCRLQIVGEETGTVSIFENATPGWVLDEVVCQGVGIEFTILEDGFSADCIQGQGQGTCTFFNVRGETPSNVPTLSEWGMIAAAAGLMIVGVLFAVRRKRLQASE